MHLRRTRPSRTFHATAGGAGLDSTHPCEHGMPAVTLHLFSEHDGTSKDIGILLPMCIAPGLIGALVGLIDEVMGSEDADKFVAGIQAAREQAVRQITAEKAAHRAVEEACCEAGYRTQGREHTCDLTTPPTTA